MIDLHIHSNNSDGTKTVKEILIQAQNLSLSTISFTDHETCSAYDELEKINIKDYFAGKIINGIELKSRYKDIVMDILGYGIDYKKMKKYLAECYKDMTREKIQEEQLKKFYEIGQKIKLTLRPIEELKWNKTKDWSTIVFYDEMKSHIENKEKVPSDMWESFKNFKQNHYHIKGDIFYIDRGKHYPKIETIIDIIHKSGGKAFVAHIYEYKEIENKISELEKIINNYKIDGIECYHSIFSEKENLNLLEFAKKHDLLISGGSDYHGDNKPDIELGVGKGNLNVPNEILDKWIFC
ncbi:MAG: PHP domain-containing protein [Clostridia bacterium]|nr:PHP domain-containing protein [Clostridia bacterium]